MLGHIYWVRLYIDTLFLVRYRLILASQRLSPMRKLITTIVLIAWSGGLALGAGPTADTVVFENGFTAILIENHGTPMIGSSVIVKAGSIHENA